jgi:hypothetical protein
MTYCKYENCNISSEKVTHGLFYGDKNNCKREYCYKHAVIVGKNCGVKIMNVSKKSRLCNNESCLKRGNFTNTINGKKVKFCAEHNVKGLKNTTEKKCKREGCKTLPCYNYEGEITRLYCSEHKIVGMVNVKDRNRICKYDGCKKRPHYGNKDDKLPTYCVVHKKKIMSDITHKKCKHDRCEKIATYGNKNTKIISHCKQHSLKNMVDLWHKKCICCKFSVVSNNKYGKYCAECFSIKFPEKYGNHLMRYKGKETIIRRLIKRYFNKKYPSISVVCDKIIDGQNCNVVRPDFRIEMLTHTIIIECDENQHKRYDKMCENKRLMQIYTALANRPLVVIRFNPDKYIDCEKKSHNELFYMGKTLKTVEINKKEAYRIIHLLKKIVFYIKLKNVENLKALNLELMFYDNVKNNYKITNKQIEIGIKQFNFIKKKF